MYTDPLDSINIQLMARRCPPGSYCPTPQEQLACQAGTYCVGGSLEPFSCNLGSLVQQDALADVPQPKQTLLEQLYEKGEPLGGNFCPEQAVTPAGMCAPLPQFFCTVLLGSACTAACAIAAPCWQHSPNALKESTMILV